MSDNARLYAEQMAEVPKVEGIIEGLREELNRCPATKRGYREAAEISGSIMMWQDMRQRMLDYAATVDPAQTTSPNPPPVSRD